MTTALDRMVQGLEDGMVLPLDSGESAFKLSPFEGNPIIKPQDIGLTWRENGEVKVGAVFNGGAALFRGRVALTPRCQWGYGGRFYDRRLGIGQADLENYISEVWPLVSEDGVNFTQLQDVVIRGDGTENRDFTYGIEDIRIVKHGPRYLLVGCGKLKPPFKGGDGDRIAVYSTEDFVEIAYHGIIGPLMMRNAIPLSEPVNGLNWMLLRFYPNIHLDFLEAGMDQLLNPRKYEKQWRRINDRRGESLLLEAGRYPHEKEKVGSGPPVIRTDRGWLLIYHALGEIEDSVSGAYGLAGKIDRAYSVCAALLDLENPRKVLCRTRHPIYIPSAAYELYGDDQYPVDVPAVVFPVGAIVRRGKLIIYAGAGDKYMILLSCNLGTLVDYLWDYCRYIP